MKLKLDLSATDLMELNDPETTEDVRAEAHAMLDEIFDNKDTLIKCSITMDDKDKE